MNTDTDAVQGHRKLFEDLAAWRLFTMQRYHPTSIIGCGISFLLVACFYLATGNKDHYSTRISFGRDESLDFLLRARDELFPTRDDVSGPVSRPR